MPRTKTGLLDHLDDVLDTNACDHTLRHTRAWAAEVGFPEGMIVHIVERYGGFCDCQVNGAARPRILGAGAA